MSMTARNIVQKTNKTKLTGEVYLFAPTPLKNGGNQ